MLTRNVTNLGWRSFGVPIIDPDFDASDDYRAVAMEIAATGKVVTGCGGIEDYFGYAERRGPAKRNLYRPIWADKRVRIDRRCGEAASLKRRAEAKARTVEAARSEAERAAVARQRLHERWVSMLEFEDYEPVIDVESADSQYAADVAFGLEHG